MCIDPLGDRVSKIPGACELRHEFLETSCPYDYAKYVRLNSRPSCHDPLVKPGATGALGFDGEFLASRIDRKVSFFLSQI
jgi:hypothetical protein